MSVSSRSPLMSGVLTTKRLHASTKIGVSGFPATSGIRSAAVCTADTSVPLPGAIPPATGIVQSIFVTIHSIPGRPHASSHPSPRQTPPPPLRCNPLQDGIWLLGGRADNDVSEPFQLGDDSLPTDHKHARGCGNVFGQQPHGGLRGGDNVFGREIQPQLNQLF